MLLELLALLELLVLLVLLARPVLLVLVVLVALVRRHREPLTSSCRRRFHSGPAWSTACARC